EGPAVRGRERRAQPPGAEPGRPPGERGDRRGAVAQAYPAAGDGARVLDPPSPRPHHGGADRGGRRGGVRPAAARERGAPASARRRPPTGQDDEERVMGQKVHPIGFRLGTTRTWSSRWFAGKEYANLLHEDTKIRRYIKDALYHAGISRIDVERSANRARI